MLNVKTRMPGKYALGTSLRKYVKLAIFKKKNFFFLKLYFYFLCEGGLPACVAVHHLHAVPDVARRGCLGLLGSVFSESVEKEEFCQEQVNTSASAEALLSPKKFFFPSIKMLFSGTVRIFYQSVCFLSTSLTQTAAHCEPAVWG